MTGRDGHLGDEAALAVTLGRGEPAEREHLERCPACRTLVAEWSTTRAGSVVAAASAARSVPSTVLAEALQAIRGTSEPSVLRVLDCRPAGPTPPVSRVSWTGQLISAQVPLLRRSLLSGAALLFVIGAMVALAARSGHASDVLMALAPVVAVVGLAMVQGPQVDPAAEITCSTRTSPRIVLLARLVLTTIVDLMITLALTGLSWAVTGGASFTGLVVSWFGPMLLLSALSLTLAVLTRPGIGMAVALGLWILRLSTGADPMFDLPLPVRQLPLGLVDLLQTVCTTNSPTVLVAVTLVAFAVTVTPRRLRLPA